MSTSASTKKKKATSTHPSSSPSSVPLTAVLSPTPSSESTSVTLPSIVPSPRLSPTATTTKGATPTTGQTTSTVTPTVTTTATTTQKVHPPSGVTSLPMVPTATPALAVAAKKPASNASEEKQQPQRSPQPQQPQTARPSVQQPAATSIIKSNQQKGSQTARAAPKRAPKTVEEKSNESPTVVSPPSTLPISPTSQQSLTSPRSKKIVANASVANPSATVANSTPSPPPAESAAQSPNPPPTKPANTASTPYVEKKTTSIKPAVASASSSSSSSSSSLSSSSTSAAAPSSNSTSSVASSSTQSVSATKSAASAKSTACTKLVTNSKPAMKVLTGRRGVHEGEDVEIEEELDEPTPEQIAHAEAVLAAAARAKERREKEKEKITPATATATAVPHSVPSKSPTKQDEASSGKSSIAAAGKAPQPPTTAASAALVSPRANKVVPTSTTSSTPRPHLPATSKSTEASSITAPISASKPSHPTTTSKPSPSPSSSPIVDPGAPIDLNEPIGVDEILSDPEASSPVKSKSKSKSSPPTTDSAKKKRIPRLCDGEHHDLDLLNSPKPSPPKKKPLNLTGASTKSKDDHSAISTHREESQLSPEAASPSKSSASADAGVPSTTATSSTSQENGLPSSNDSNAAPSEPSTDSTLASPKTNKSKGNVAVRSMSDKKKKQSTPSRANPSSTSTASTSPSVDSPLSSSVSSSSTKKRKPTSLTVPTNDASPSPPSSKSEGATPNSSEHGSLTQLRQRSHAASPAPPASSDSVASHTQEKKTTQLTDEQLASLKRSRSMDFSSLEESGGLLAYAHRQRVEDEALREREVAELASLQLRKRTMEEARHRLNQAKRYIGVEIVDAPRTTDTDKDGVKIIEVKSGSSAASAKLAVGDIILSFNGIDVTSRSVFGRVLKTMEIGQTVEVVYKRPTKKGAKSSDSPRTVTLRVGCSDLTSEEVEQLETTLKDESAVTSSIAQLQARHTEQHSERLTHQAVALSEVQAQVFVAEVEQKAEVKQLETAVVKSGELEVWKKAKVHLGLELVDVNDRKFKVHSSSATTSPSSFSSTNTEPPTNGAMKVSKIFPGESAERAGLQVNDMIIMVNSFPTANRADFEKILKGQPRGVASSKAKPIRPCDRLDLVILRGAPTKKGLDVKSLASSAPLTQIELSVQVGALGMKYEDVVKLRRKVEHYHASKQKADETAKRTAADQVALKEEKKQARSKGLQSACEEIEPDGAVLVSSSPALGISSQLLQLTNAATSASSPIKRQHRPRPSIVQEVRGNEREEEEDEEEKDETERPENIVEEDEGQQ